MPNAGAFEPIRVGGAQFFPGPLPTGTTGPMMGTINAPSTVLNAGFGSWSISGDTDMAAYAILMRFADIGTGYWSVPVGPPDAVTAGMLTWSASCAFSWSTPPGSHDLDFVAIDANGSAGPVEPLTLTIQSNIPVGKAVVTLRWDSAADLDLHLIAPDGTELWSQHPNTYAGTDGMVPPGTATLDRDSNAACVQDNYREEDAIFATAPIPGNYLVRVDMVSACGAPSADFIVEIRIDGKVVQHVAGLLLAMDADFGGPGTGLFVTQQTF